MNKELLKIELNEGINYVIKRDSLSNEDINKHIQIIHEKSNINVFAAYKEEKKKYYGFLLSKAYQKVKF